MSRKTVLLIGIAGICVCIIGGAYYSFFMRAPIDPASSFAEEYQIGLRTYEGKEVFLSEFKRKLLVIHSFASWCTYCAEELKNLARLKEIYGDDIQIVAVNRAEPESDARTFTDNLSLTGIEILLDPEDAFYKEIEGYAMPETVFISNSGEVLFHERGPLKMQAVIERINVMLEKK